MILESLAVENHKKDCEKAVKIHFQEAGTFILCRVAQRMGKKLMT